MCTIGILKTRIQQIDQWFWKLTSLKKRSTFRSISYAITFVFVPTTNKSFFNCSSSWPQAKLVMTWLTLRSETFPSNCWPWGLISCGEWIKTYRNKSPSINWTSKKKIFFYTLFPEVAPTRHGRLPLNFPTATVRGKTLFVNCKEKTGTSI